MVKAVLGGGSGRKPYQLWPATVASLDVTPLAGGIVEEPLIYLYHGFLGSLFSLGENQDPALPDRAMLVPRRQALVGGIISEMSILNLCIVQCYGCCYN